MKSFSLGVVGDTMSSRASNVEMAAMALVIIIAFSLMHLVFATVETGPTPGASCPLEIE